MLKKFLEFASGNFIALFLGLISSPIITRLIMPEEMGKFSLFNTITSVLFLFVMCGMDQAYVRYYNAENEVGKIDILKDCIGVSCAVGSFVSIIIMAFYPFVSDYIVGTRSFLVCLLLVLNIFSSILQRFALLEVRMSMQAKFYSVLNIWHKSSYIMLVFGFYSFLKNNSYVLMIATVGSNIACWIVCVMKSKQIWLRILGCFKFSRSVKKLLVYGFPFVFSNTINWIFEYMDRISIRHYCGFSEIGLYSAASTIVALLTACQLAFSSFWVPVAYEKYENDVNCNSFFVRVNRIVSYCMIMIAVAMVAFKDLIIILLGPEYKNAMFIFPFLTFMPIMYTISETTVMGINFKKKTHMHIYVATASAVVNLLGNTILVPLYGARGAAISTGLSYVVFFVVRTVISRKLYKVDYKMKSMWISLLLLFFLTIYSSFNSFNTTILLIAFVDFILITVMYKDVVLTAVTAARAYIEKR